jgi:hypothetical protein
MLVEITCPRCSFSRKVPRKKIPDRAKWATCPSCKHRFELIIPEAIAGPALQEAPGGDESGDDRVPTPWENRSKFGLWTSIYQTCKSVLFSPEAIFSKMKFGVGIREPLAFGLLLGSVGTMFGVFWQFLVMSGTVLTLTQHFVGQFTMGLIFLGLIIICPLFVLISMFLISAVLHLFLITFRGGKNGFEATFRVVSYSQATQILGLIPFLGGIVGLLWIIVVQIIGLREIHETSYLKVICVFLIPPALIFFLVVASAIAVFLVA